MIKVQFYFQNESHGSLEIRQCAISDWYCKPLILSMLALKSKALFVTCDKYGCRQFIPKYSESFPVHRWTLICYKKNLPWLVLEFNDYSDPLSWPDVDDFIFKLGFVKDEADNRDNG